MKSSSQVNSGLASKNLELLDSWADEVRVAVPVERLRASFRAESAFCWADRSLAPPFTPEERWDGDGQAAWP